MGYLDEINGVAASDLAGIRKKEESYGDSWKRRGGANAFFMLCRKFDRMEKQVERHHYDIFTAAEADERPEGIIDDIRDLRRYLMLVEAELIARSKSERNPCEKRFVRQQPTDTTPVVRTNIDVEPPESFGSFSVGGGSSRSS